MNRTLVRPLVTGLAAISTACVLSVAACGGGELPKAESDESILRDAGTKKGEVTFDIDLAKGVTFGDQGLVNCGTQASPQFITMTNTSSDIVNYTVTLADGADRYDIDPVGGGITPNGTAQIKISPKAIPAESDVAPDQYAGTLEVKFPGLNVPPTTIRLHQTARGAIIASSAVNTVELGSVKVGETATKALSLTNSGNLPATASFQLGTEVFTIGGAAQGSVVLAPNASESRELKLAPKAAGDLADTLAISYNPAAVFCKTPPTSLALTGKGTTSVGVQPGSLDFGQVNCGSTGEEQVITITSTIGMDFTLALAKATQFTLKDKDNKTLQLGTPIRLDAASTFTLKVEPKQIPPSSPVTDNLYGDVLTITTTVTGDTPHVIPFKMTAKGAILAFSPAAGIITTSSTPSSTTASNFSISNTGNAQVPYTLRVTNLDGTTFSGPAGTFLLGGDLSVTGNLSTGQTNLTLNSKAPSTFNTSVDGALTLSVTTSANAALCADLPPRYSLKANTVAGTSITLTPPALEFGEVDCGSTAPSKVVTVASVVATNFTPDLVLGANSPYTLAHNGTPIVLGQAIPIAAGENYAITVIPKPMPSRPLQGTNVNAFGDTMTIKSPVDPTKNYDLRQTAKGVIFAFNPLLIRGKGAQTFNLVNNGNVTGNYTLTSTGGALNLSTGNAPKGNTPGVVTLTSSGAIKVTSTSLLCADLPGDLILEFQP